MLAMSLCKRGTQTTLGLPGSGLSYRSSRRPWGHAGAGNGGMIAVAIAALAIIAAAILSAS
jgi:hypothetical protein